MGGDINLDFNQLFGISPLLHMLLISTTTTTDKEENIDEFFGTEAENLTVEELCCYSLEWN